MITPEEIESFLHGNDPEEHIVAIEYDWASENIFKIKEIPGKGKEIRKDTFTPFAWVGDLHGLNFYKSSKANQKEAMTKHGILIEKLETGDNERLEKGLKYMVKSLKGYRNLIQFFKDGGLDPWGDIRYVKRTTDKKYLQSVETNTWVDNISEAIKFDFSLKSTAKAYDKTIKQLLKASTLFEEFNPKDLILIPPPVEQYLIQKEKRLFKGYEEYNDITRLGFDLETTSLEPKDGRIFMIGIKTNKGLQKVIECATEDQERAGLVEFFRIIDEIKPSIIGGYNSFNFDWYWIMERCKALHLDIKRICKTLHPEYKFKETKGMLKLANEVEEFKQVGMWGYNVIDILHSVRRAQAINSSIKSAGLKYITQYINAEAPDRVYIDHNKIGSMYANKEEYWLNVQNGKYKKADNPQFNNLDKKHPGVYIKTTGDDIVERYLDDDLEETLKVDEEFNQGTFMLASMIPTTYERASTLGTATIWKLIMMAWSYKYKLAIPQKEQKKDFVGGLSRLLRVGYSKDVLKLDYSSLYPSIQLVHDVFPDCDVMGGMKAMLTYFRNERIKNKNLASEWKSKDKKVSQKFDRLQLPLKIFINSLFGALSAPQVFAWGDMKQGEMITCTGRQYLRQMVMFFTKKGYTPLVLDTDGVNFSLPSNVDERVYIGQGINPQIVKGKEYKGYDADVAEYNELFMKSPMFLDCDGTWKSCINLARKNYATMEHNGKVKLTGNSIKSKKLPLYIEDFLDVAIKHLLEGEGQKFVEWYYEYLTKIFNMEIPLLKIAQRAKVKLSIKDYIERSKQTTKSGGAMSRMAHLELAIKHNLKINLGDVIYYVNNGTKASHGDVQKKKDEVLLNCYMLDSTEIEDNPNMTGEYNVARAVSAFNKRIEPLLVVFKQDVRDNLLVDNPIDRAFFTKEQSELINGFPFEPKDQDTLEDLLKITPEELSFWDKKGINPNYIYELAEEGWEEHI